MRPRSGNDAKRMTTRNTIALKAVITGMLIPSLFIAAPLELAFAGRLTKTIAHEEYKAAANESDIVVLSENSIPEAATQIILPNDAASENFDLNINIHPAMETRRCGHHTAFSLVSAAER